MEKKEFQVEVVSRQRAVYRVEAADADGARRAAIERWKAGEPGDLDGFEWSEVETVAPSEVPSEALQRQDEELLLRFIRERERQLGRLGATFHAAIGNDAISAFQAATDLGWYLPDSLPDQPHVDAVRAVRALERLCGNKQLVCFERPRVREGERGDIRLYCTSEYLETLSSALRGAASPALQ